jgi:hypothetical protein
MKFLSHMVSVLLLCVAGMAVADSARPAEPPVESAAHPVRPDERSPYFSHRSNLLVGEKGEQALDVSIPQSRCGDAAWAFDRAELIIESARFGHAQMVQIPESGCVVCRPLVVRWFHEPTGHLQFSIEVFRRQIRVECPVAPGESLGSSGRPLEPNPLESWT